MILRRYRLQNTGDASAGGGSETLMTDGANTTPAASSPASTEATGTPAANADATQQPLTDAQKAEAAATQEAADKTAADEAAALKSAEKVAPEKYEIKAPDGATLDPEALGEFEGIARELKLTNEDAQKVADIGAKLALKWETKQAETIQKAAAEWAAAATADKEYGGEKLTESLVSAKKALDAFGTPELRTLLNDSRLGNHPEVIRFMVKAGKAISEDRMVTGGAGPATAGTNVAKSLYPNQS